MEHTIYHINENGDCLYNCLKESEFNKKWAELEGRKNITYEKIDLILPERREELIADLKARTGIDIIRVEIRRIDFLRDTANLRIFYYEEDTE